MRAGGADPTAATSTPPKIRLCNHLIINALQRRENQGVEVVEKFLGYFHGALSKSLIYK